MGIENITVSHEPKRVRTSEEIAVQDLAYHIKQFERPYRSTIALAEFVRSVLKTAEGEALDVACGAGANIFHMAQALAGFRWTGLDMAGRALFPVSQPIFKQHKLPATLVSGDYYKLTEIFPGKKFDLVLSIQTLLTIPEYERALEQLLAVTGGWLFVTSLFTDFDVDAKVEVTDYSWPAGMQSPYHYSVWSLARFRSYCEERSCLEFVSRDFEIDIDLAPPETNGFGTYTRTLADGRRLQFSGPLFQPWKFVGVRMG